MLNNTEQGQNNSLYIFTHIFIFCNKQFFFSFNSNHQFSFNINTIACVSNQTWDTFRHVFTLSVTITEDVKNPISQSYIIELAVHFLYNLSNGSPSNFILCHLIIRSSYAKKILFISFILFPIFREYYNVHVNKCILSFFSF